MVELHGIPGTAARQKAPMSSGTSMHCTRVDSKWTGESVIDDVAAPKTPNRTNGIVNTPSKLLPTVKSNASAVLPPHCCVEMADDGDALVAVRRMHTAVRLTPVESVVGMQQNTASPITSSVGCNGKRSASMPSTGVMSRIATKP